MEFPKPKDEEQAANAMPEVERKQVRGAKGPCVGDGGKAGPARGEGPGQIRRGWWAWVMAGNHAAEGRRRHSCNSAKHGLGVAFWVYVGDRRHALLLCGCVLQELSADKCYKILSQISDEDCRAMGFDTRYTRPDWMLVSVLPVPPPPVRPSVMMDSSARCVFCPLPRVQLLTYGICGPADG